MDGILAAVPHVAHQAFFGGVAAVGFGVLFNFGWRRLLWCMAAGAFALTVRTVCQDAGWSLEAATFAAAAATSCASLALRGRIGVAGQAVALAGCIPMVPGAFFGQALLGFLDLTAPHPENPVATATQSMAAMLRVIFTLGAIGAGLSIPPHLLRNRDF
ncbi:threonine/serine exporter family protein [Azospirillum sp. ST 5-10]|uniref:threonine/serine exporter family protein n=1 Tax=unclassified Azospirillum TaxID=2630922 RepID=UPI003F4A5F8B